VRVQQCKTKYTVKGIKGCRHCGKTIKVGEWFASTRMPNNPITDPYFNIHVKCMALMVDKAGHDETAQQKAEANFHALREKIAATGSLYPD